MELISRLFGLSKKEHNVKMMIVMRKDLKMGKGKIAAQSGHACVSAILMALAKEGKLEDVKDLGGHVSLAGDGPLSEWFSFGGAKICVSVNSEEELLEIYRQTKEAGITSALIRDAGLTEFHGVATYTCLAMEPLPAEKVDPITGNLPLY